MEESSILIEQLFHIMDEGRPNLKRSSRMGDGVDQAIAVGLWLDAFDCKLAFKMYVHHLKWPSVPPLILFMIGAELGHPELCADAVKGYSVTWATASWAIPPDLGDTAANLSTLNVRAIPRHLFMSLSHDHLFALQALEPVELPRKCEHSVAVLDSSKIVGQFRQLFYKLKQCAGCRSNTGCVWEQGQGRRCPLSR